MILFISIKNIFGVPLCGFDEETFLWDFWALSQSLSLWLQVLDVT